MLLIAVVVGINTLTAQNFLPIPEGEGCGQPFCPPVLSFSQSTLDGVDELGGILENEDCEGSNAPWGCLAAKWLADQLPCMYHSSTPQGSLCGKDDKPDKPDETQPDSPDEAQPDKPNPDNPAPQEPNPDAPPQNPPKPDEDTPQGETLYINPSTTPLGWSWGASQSGTIKESFVQWVSKLKNGSLIAKGKYGYTLTKHSAYYKDKKKKDVILIMILKNRKGQIIGNPSLITSDKQLTMVDLAAKSKKWPLK